jgi:beta-N-acetylhexosaminidase
VSSELEQLAARCLLAGFEGPVVPDSLRRWLERGLGGVCLFAWNVESRKQVAELTAELRREASELIVSIDEEGGDVTRLDAAGGSSYPGNLALGYVDDVELTEAVARAMGAELAGVGVNLDLAPVADVNANAANPIVGVRSFGSDPALVARHVAAFVRGLQRSGVAACAKHFPGHGDTEEDSHLELPTVERDDAAMKAMLLPFQAAIDAGVRAIMSAHIRVAGLDEAPATMSRALLTDVLRGELGFAGLVVTDAIEMRAISGTVGAEEGAVRALEAGADALCLGHDLPPDAVHRAIVGAVESGRLSEERLESSAARVLALVGATPGTPVDGEVPRIVGLEAARRAVRAEGEVQLNRPARVVELLPEPSIAAGAADHGLGELLGSTEDGQLVVVVQDAHRHPELRSEATRLLEQAPDAVLVETGVPEWRPSGVAFLATHGRGRVNLEAAAELLLGQ